ncbi:MAG: hypothetical protein JST06_07800 [Bacteroidetes bacterium]|nr:hypothetical protein [Bacteroidota bacterium]MBS1629144.1 hypothetical protein [Bacteroidota bacterium]
MNLLFNASNLRHGGGKTVALQLLSGMAVLRPEDTLFVLAPDMPEFAALAQHSNIRLLPVPKAFHHSWPQKLWQVYFKFPSLCRQHRIQKIISLGNVAFPAKGIPQLVYIQLAQLVHHDAPAWKRMPVNVFLRNRLMDGYVAFQLRYASAFAVQTTVMRRRFAARFHMPESSVFILPNAATEEPGFVPASLPEPLLPLRLLFLSRYYVHKNFECLPELCRLIQERNLPIEISLTLDEYEAPGLPRLLHTLSGFRCVKNLGHLSLAKLGAALDAHHGIFLPTLLESYSGAYAEAILHRRLIFTSHYDFATELLGDAAYYFDPLSPSHMIQVLEEALRQPESMNQKLLSIEKLAAQMPRVHEVCIQCSKIIDSL